MVTLPPWLVGLAIVYAISITAMFLYRLIAGDPARRPADEPTDHDAEILAVAEEGVAQRPECAEDDEEVLGRTVALTDAAMDGALDLLARDLEAHPEDSVLSRVTFQRLLIEIGSEMERYRAGKDITEGAPKERP